MTIFPNKAALISSKNVRTAFNRSAQHYDRFSILQQTVVDRLIEHFDQIKINPKSILDLGSGTGVGSKKLQRRFRNARLYQLDIAEIMLQQSCSHLFFFRKNQPCICADARAIPILDDHFDLVFSSLMLQWCPDIDAVFSEIRRILKPGGIFLFASFGPDTLKELKQSWAFVDEMVHVNMFIDMHDIGDALIRHGLDAPVLSVEHIVMTYANGWQLMRELKGMGAHNINEGRNKSMTGKTKMQAMLRHYEQFRAKGKLPASFEVIYGHAWCAANNRRDQEHFVPVASLKRS